MAGPGTKTKTRYRRCVDKRRIPILGHFLYPHARIKLRLNGEASWTAATSAIVDTGAAATLLHMVWAKNLGLEPDDVRKAKPFAFRGLSNQPAVAYPCRLDIGFFYNCDPCLLLTGTFVGFTDALEPGRILLGQRGCFEHVTLIHKLHAPAGWFSLEQQNSVAGQ